MTGADDKTIPVRPKWLFVLCGKNTPHAAWWLKIQSQAQLAEYLAATNGKYGRAFENYLHDSFYQPSETGHGKHAAEAPLTLAIYLHAMNQNLSMIDAAMQFSMQAAQRMSEALALHGAIYINSVGGWNCGGMGLLPEGGFLHAKNLTWPNFTKQDIRISSFHDGRHYYAYVGQAQVRDGDRVKFDSYDEARRQALAYLTPTEQE